LPWRKAESFRVERGSARQPCSKKPAEEVGTISLGIQRTAVEARSVV
jgi:hypothetical protein